MSKKLVAYFSASGVTGRVAKILAEAANADLYEIKPQIPYTTADLNWMDKESRSTIEMQDKTTRPVMADHDAPVADADVIFVGFPIWRKGTWIRCIRGKMQHICLVSVLPLWMLLEHRA